VNHLAHALLAADTGTSIVGALMGDFVKGRPGDLYSGALLEGILLHREVDAFTDAHEIFARSRRRIAAPHRRFSGVLVDIFYDHFLARHWSEFSPVPLRAFADDVHARLARRESELPERMRGFVRYMIETDLLVSYRERSGIERALRGMSSRLSRPNPLAGGLAALDAEHAGLERDFFEFFPELRAAFGRGRSSGS
jgi:acyl carrier protein phosphodiesterase